MAEGTARDAVLGRVRRALGAEAGSTGATRLAWEALPRGFKRVGALGRAAVMELLVERLRDYDAQVVVVADAAGVPEAVATLLRARGVRRMVVPAGMPEGVLREGFECVVDAGFSAAELDGFDGVVTMASVAIAETGTVVLQNVPGQGRRAATLVPDYHLCIVHAADVVETVPEAMARLHPTSTLATTFVSGPSATADIEMTRIKGVHGPRSLDVILVGSPH